MARRGRKRRYGPRERNGKPKRSTKKEQIDETVRLARAQPHRRALKSNDRISERAESALGRLSLTRVRIGGHDLPLITPGMWAAGEAFAAIVDRYRGVIEGPRPMRSLMPETASESLQASDDQNAAPRFDCPSQYADPTEQRMQLAGRSFVTRGWPCQAAGEVCVCAERRTRYMRAYEAIARAGRRALMAVIAVAVRGEELAAGELVYLQMGLSAAQRHLGLQDIDRP